jgi:GNAT superfamily N-acetyltransferase
MRRGRLPEGAQSLSEGQGRRPEGAPVTGLLRVALRADIAQIQRVRHAVRENRLTSGVITDDEVRQHLESLGRGWVIEVDATVRAFAIGNKVSENVWALFVEQGHEQRGFGRRLHDTMMAWFWAEGVARVWLSTTPGTRAERFYRAAGWRMAGPAPHGELRFEIERPDRAPACPR